MLNRALLLALLVPCVATPCACGPRASAPAKPIASTKPPTVETPAEEPPEPVEPAPAEAVSAAESNAEPLPVEPAAPPESCERILLVTPGGPLIIEIALRIDGKPFDAALSALAREALEAADTDEDGRPTWKEVLESPKFKFGQFGNNPITPEMTLKSLTEMYDTNRDGLMNAGEVPKFLTKNMAGPSAFSLRSTNQDRGDNIYESPSRRWLDEDENGKLSTEEMAAAPVRLRARDANDDDLLIPSDFVAIAADLQPGQPPRQRRTRRDGIEAAHLLGAKARWNSVLVALEEQFGADGTSGGDLTLSPDLFKRLDLNESFSLDRKEAEALITLEPHLKLAAEFERAVGKNQAQARIKLVQIAPQIADKVKIASQEGTRLALALSGATLEFYCLDSAPAADYDAQAKSVLEMFDGDKNGYVEKRELPEGNEALVAPFETLDADGDGKVYLADIMAQLSRQQAALLGQIQARAGDNEDALFAALDTDADGRLSSREIAASAKRLESLDTNADGLLETDEIPESLVVGLVRGDPQAETGALVAPPPLARQRPVDVPAWFARMDSNTDGEISPREFLGSLEKFRQLDSNADGYLSLVEAKGE